MVWQASAENGHLFWKGAEENMQVAHVPALRNQSDQSERERVRDRLTGRHTDKQTHRQTEM